MLPKLTNREEQVYKFIKQFIKEKGIPPTNREIADYFNIAPKNAFKYLTILEKKGYIKRAKKISRGISICENSDVPEKFKKVPFISYVAAGEPIDIDVAGDSFYVVDDKLFPHSNIFMFKVIGDSMIDAHIEEGDIAVVSPDEQIRDNDIVVVSIYNEITLKRFVKRDGTAVLHPENKNYKDIILNHINPEELRIIGKVVGIIRKMS